MRNHLTNLVESHVQLGDTAAALESSRRSLALSQELARDFPSVADYRESVAGDYLNLGNTLAGVGNDAEAERAYRRSLELYEALVTDFPAVPLYRQDFADCLQGLSSFLEEQGRCPEALPPLRRAHGIYRQLAEESPQTPGYRTRLGEARAELVCLLAIDLGPDGRYIAEESRLAEQAIAQEPAHSRSLEMLAAARYRAGDFAGAVAAMNKSLELEPRETPDLLWLALAYGRLGDKDRARALYDRAVTWIESNAPRNLRLARLRSEAAALLGVTNRPGSTRKENATPRGSKP